MEMTREPVLYSVTASRAAAAAVTRILEDDQWVPPMPGTYDEIMAGAAFLGNVLFLSRVGAGQNPRSAASLLDGAGGRGAELARQFLGSAAVEICCSYCGGLMLSTLAMATADQVTRLAGPDAAAQAWRSLAAAVIPAEPPFPIEGPLPREPRPYVT